MVSLRRLRAVLLLSIVSAIGWGVAGTMIFLGLQVAYGRSIRPIVLSGAFGVFAFFGLIAGALYAVALAMVPAREGAGSFSGWRATLFGLLGGTGVYLGLVVTQLLEGAPPWLMAIFGVIGGATGFAIQRVAQRGALPAGSDAPGSLHP